jgi:hypothetical protein
VVRPDLEMEVSLWAPAHSRCNKLGEAAFSGDGGGHDDLSVPDSPRPNNPSAYWEPGLGWVSERW